MSCFIGLRANWLLSRGSVGWWEQWKRCGSSTAGSKLPTVELCDLWKPSRAVSVRHNMTSPFMSHQLKRNPTAIIHQPIKKLCIIYHVICKFNQIEYSFQLILGNFFLQTRTRKEKYVCNLILSITLTLHFYSAFTAGFNFCRYNQRSPPEMWWQFFKYKTANDKAEKISRLHCARPAQKKHHAYEMKVTSMEELSLTIKLWPRGEITLQRWLEILIVVHSILSKLKAGKTRLLYPWYKMTPLFLQLKDSSKIQQTWSCDIVIAHYISNGCKENFSV